MIRVEYLVSQRVCSRTMTMTMMEMAKQMKMLTHLDDNDTLKYCIIIVRYVLYLLWYGYGFGV
jgi:hypothetical protein